MKRFFAFLAGLLLTVSTFSQSTCWVCFTDKAQCRFDPYTYFDAKAIERRLQQGVPLNDSSDYPLNANYSAQVSALSEEVIGESRWLNAVAVSASEEAMERIAALPFVKKIIPIRHEMYTTSHGMTDGELKTCLDNLNEENTGLHPQLKRMGGERFAAAGMNGKGIRIAVLDAGFPMVDKHEAFRHLFENNRIIATYNFPKKQENVYGWHSHGTMTLSCIAGLAGKDEPYTRLGMAPEAEFLLARTEVNAEPLKEEVWWVMGLEWAERKGANIVSSSLGYGDINHEIADLNGQSPISRAANMAAAKGILICNSAGNEGTKKAWPRIIIPADADSVLTVGGINPRTGGHQDFSSYGPTADGRLKPNVCAYASRCRVAGSGNNHSYEWVDGTSFSCPLVAGFAACAWQSHPEYNAMQLKAEIEKSGDLFPYFDYAMGYGVPQAAYFLDNVRPVAERTMDVYREGSDIVIQPLNYRDGDIIYYHFRRADGRILSFENIQLEFAFPGSLRVADVDSADILCVHFNGYTETLQLRDLPAKMSDNGVQQAKNSAYQFDRIAQYRMGGRFDNPSTWDKEAKNHFGLFISCGFNLPTQALASTYSNAYSSIYSVGLLYQRKLSRWYGLGLSVEGGTNHYFFHRDELKLDDEYVGLDNSGLDVEFYQHFRLLASGQGGLGLDLGIVGRWNYGNTWVSRINKTGGDAGYMHGFKLNSTYTENLTQEFPFANPFTAGARLRISYSDFALFAQYDFIDIFKARKTTSEEDICRHEDVEKSLNAYRLKVGIQIRY